MANSAEIMKLDIQRIRLASKHAGLKGGAAEEILAKFLRQRLPASLGITTGHVVDAHGTLSKQADVIVYDTLRTPILFESALDGWDVVPAEGVVAVIEVKMHLTAPDLSEVVANCDSVMQLSRDAYIGDPIQTVQAYGSTWSELPIYYSLFAFESDNMYAAELNELLAEHPVHQRIGSVCYLPRGVNLHADLSDGDSKFVPVATALATLVDIETPNALLLWLTAVSTVASVAAVRRPIDLIRYAPDEHRGLQGKIGPATPAVARRRVLTAGEQTLVRLGVAPAIAANIGTKILDRLPLNDAEVQAIQAVGGQLRPDGTGGQTLILPTQ